MNNPITKYDEYLNMLDVLSRTNANANSSTIITPTNNTKRTGAHDKDINSGFKYAIADNPINNKTVVNIADIIIPFLLVYNEYIG